MQLFKFKSQETIRKFSLRQQLTYVSHIWEYPSWHQEIYKNGVYLSITFLYPFLWIFAARKECLVIFIITLLSKRMMHNFFHNCFCFLFDKQKRILWLRSYVMALLISDAKLFSWRGFCWQQVTFINFNFSQSWFQWWTCSQKHVQHFL